MGSENDEVPIRYSIYPDTFSKLGEIVGIYPQRKLHFPCHYLIRIDQPVRPSTYYIESLHMRPKVHSFNSWSLIENLHDGSFEAPYSGSPVFECRTRSKRLRFSLQRDCQLVDINGIGQWNILTCFEYLVVYRRTTKLADVGSN
jgi:hypothetical protein